MTQPKLHPALAWTLFVILALIWGSSFILMKRGLLTFSYGQIGLLRISLAFLFTLLIAFPHLKKLEKRHIFPLIVVGLFGNLIPYLLFPLAITHLDSSLTGILNSLVPLFTLLIGLVWFQLKVKWMSVVGIILGFVGALWLLLPDMTLDTTRLTYGAYPILATICYAISINTIQSKLGGLKPLTITLLSLSFVGIPAILFLLSTDFVEVMQTAPNAWLSFAYIAILGIVGSSLAVIIFNMLIQRSSSLFAASVTYAIPIVALFWGLFDGESVGATQAAGMSTILIGVYLVNRKGSLRDRIMAKKKGKKNPA